MYNNERKLQELFVALLKEKYPNHLAGEIADILPLEKEAIYRRLRGDVPFSFVEMATISTALSISLDTIANIVSPYRSQYYQLHIRDYNELKPIDLNMSYNYIKAINAAAEDPNSEFGIAANMLPLHIGLMHLPLYRIYLLKWKYQFGKNTKKELNYSDIHIPELEEDTFRQYQEAIKRINYTFFIWDNSFFMSLINDINYFYNIRFISNKEMQVLKQEMSALLDTIENYADEGAYDTGNRLDTYVSSLNFDTTYTYFSGGNIHISMHSTYNLGAFTSLEREACSETKNWIQGLKKSSTLISGVAQQEKILFFEKQRLLLDNYLISENS